MSLALFFNVNRFSCEKMLIFGSFLDQTKLSCQFGSRHRKIIITSFVCRSGMYANDKSMNVEFYLNVIQLTEEGESTSLFRGKSQMMRKKFSFASNYRFSTSKINEG